MWLVLSLAAVLAVAADLPEGGSLTDEVEGDDLSCLQGAWMIRSMVESGHKVPTELIAGVLCVIADNKFCIVSKAAALGSRAKSGTITLDITRRPRSIDFRTKDIVARGIYRVENDVLTICVRADDSKERPRDFSATRGSGVRVMMFQRVRK
jgi:uncharacterized protein (TIGR03067 family)